MCFGDGFRYRWLCLREDIFVFQGGVSCGGMAPLLSVRAL